MAASIPVPQLRRRLLAWYDRNARDLPWRGRDVYGVWVSETMLQQTRVDVVVPYYQRWMQAWPDVRDLAQARPDDVARRWAGLGYYARARNLHAAAGIVARTGWPRDLAGWRSLPGVGPYTAAAVTSIALQQPNACVDGNVVRVVARLSGEGGDVRTAATRRRIESLAQAWLAPRRPGDWNQAMMDLGATVCTPRKPQCARCPVAPLCAARQRGDPARIPAIARAKPARVERKAFALVERRGRILLVRQDKGLLAGTWLLPGGTAPHGLAAAVAQQTGQAIDVAAVRGRARHVFSHRVWTMSLHGATLRTGKAAASPAARDPGVEVRWVAWRDLDAEALPTAMRTLLAAAGTAAKPKSKGGSATP